MAVFIAQKNNLKKCKLTIVISEFIYIIVYIKS